jgi:large subunit ribosomal protein L24
MKNRKTLSIRKGDEVVVTTGVAKGEKGKVMRVLTKKGRVLIEGVNLRRRHVRARKQGEKGQIVMVPAPVHVSNVKILSGAKRESDDTGQEQ